MTFMNTSNLWTNACGHLKKVLNQDVYSRWIETIKPGELKQNLLILYVDNDFCRDWLINHYQQIILNALHVAGLEQDFKIEFHIDPNQIDNEIKASEVRVETEQPKKRYRQNGQATTAFLNPNFTFENFVLGQSNSFAHAAALAVSQAPARAYNPLFIYGETGIGKTHLMQAIGHRVLQSPGMRVTYVSLESLLNEFVNSIKTASTADFRAKYRKTDLLLVDDIQFLQGKEGLQDEFFHTFNVLYDAHKQIILTSDLPPREMSGLEPRLVSRFEWGLVTQIELPDFETRLAILRYKQSLNKIPISDEVLTFIANNIKSNVRSLEGALTRAISFSSLHNQSTLTINVLQHLLKDLLDNESQKDLSFDDIQRTVADYFDLRLTDMSSKRRPRSVTAPRQIAMFLCRKLTRSSLPEIANSFGKTHATVIHACKAIQDRLQVEENFRNTVREITRKLGRDPQTFQL